MDKKMYYKGKTAKNIKINIQQKYLANISHSLLFHIITDSSVSS